MKIYFQIFLIVLVLVGSFGDCSKTEIRENSKAFDGIEPILFSGNLKNIPNSFIKPAYKMQIRFYKCAGVDFGKINPDSGTYNYKENDCRKNYLEYQFDTNGSNFTYNANAPRDWSHSFIRILDTDESAGLYSPGENPHWFIPSDIIKKSEIVNLFHDFSFVKMENLISIPAQEKLAEKLSPIIVLKKDKKFIPSNLSKFVSTYKKEIYTGKKPDSDLYEISDKKKDEYLVLDESLYGKGETHLYYHARYAKSFVSGTSEKSLPGWRDNLNYTYTKGNGDIVISYYIWYDYNEGPSSFGNKHEGDFESFAILVNSKEEPLRLMVTGHDHVMLDTKWENINSINNHPILYIAHGNKGADGGNPTSPYGGYEVSLEAGNAIFNSLANPKDIFPKLGENTKVVLPKNLSIDSLRSVRIGPGEWIDSAKTSYVDLTGTEKTFIEKLVRWEEPGILSQKISNSVHNSIEQILIHRGRLGRNPRSNLKILSLTQYGKSPVNPPFKMNGEQHFTLESPKEDRCEKARVGDYCPKFLGDKKTPQIIK
jgi:hypothetical protein